MIQGTHGDFELRSASHTSRAAIGNYNLEEDRMPSYGYWLFRRGYAEGWYSSQASALQAIYDAGFHAALS